MSDEKRAATGKGGGSQKKCNFLNMPLLEVANQKVVVVLDRSPKFAAAVPSADIAFTLRDDQNAPISGKLTKTLWNCSIEAVMEFHRVVGDLFPSGRKQLRFVTSDFVGKFLTGPWGNKLIPREEIGQALRDCEPPQASGDASSCSLFNGILLALEALSERTPLQRRALRDNRTRLEEKAETGCRGVNVAELVKEPECTESVSAKASGSGGSGQETRVGSSCSREEGEIREPPGTGSMDSKRANRTKDEEELGPVKTAGRQGQGNPRMQNRGTVLLVTSIESLADYDAINEYLAEQILERNETSRTSADRKTVRIDQVDLFVLNIATSAMAPNAQLRGQKRRPMFSSRLLSVSTNYNVLPGIHKLLQDIYGLVSTTVVGIPMKEETQQGQSVNYDVEMLHPRAAHSELSSHGLLEMNQQCPKLLDSPSAHGGLFSSVRLKWCTPTAKLKSEMFPLLLGSSPIAPAHVHNRASVCLTGFLQNGKNVMLEVSPEAYKSVKPPLEPNLKDKLISHYLSQDSSGQLVLHRVGFAKKATLGGKMSSSAIYGGEKCSAEAATQLNLKGMGQLVQAAQIQPVPRAEGKEEEGGRDKDKDDYSNGLQERVAELAQGMPFLQRNTFICNIPEKFEPLLSLIAKPALDEADFEQCRAQLQALVHARDRSGEPLTEKKFQCELFPSGTTAGVAREEQFRVAFEELAAMLQRFSCLSPLHSRLLEMFLQASGVRHKQPPKARLAKKRPFAGGAPASSSSSGSTARGLDEAEQMAQRIKQRKEQVKALWKPGEAIYFYDWWNTRYQKEFWTGWKGEFDGQKKHGDKAKEHLYPNLKLPPGQNKAAGTGTAGPIE